MAFGGKSLRFKSSPRLAALDVINITCGNTHGTSNVARSLVGHKPFVNGNRCFWGQFGCIAVLQSNIKSMKTILAVRHPLKIVQSVIRLYAVFVIYGSFPMRVWKKCFNRQPVNMASNTRQQGHLGIAIPIQRLFHDLDSWNRNGGHSVPKNQRSHPPHITHFVTRLVSTDAFPLFDYGISHT